VGREDLLRRLRDTLSAGAAGCTVALVQAIHGLGGVGKTQLALRYVYDHAADYDAVFWVTADTPAGLATAYADLARVLDLPGARRTTDINENARAVRRWLESPAAGHWLLVFDNADDPEVLRGYLPTRQPGHVLITSRRSYWGAMAQAIEVPTLPRKESIRLLLGRTGQTDAAAAGRLAEALGDLPLALAQAAGYLAEAKISLDGYLKTFATHRADLLRRGDPQDSHQLTVFTTLDLAMSQINSPEAEALLGLLSCFGPDAIPRSLLASAFTSPLAATDALLALGRHSLIRVDEHAVNVHRLVQAVAWDRLSEADRVRQVTRAVELLRAAFPENGDDVASWPSCKALQSHADHATDLANRVGAAPEAVAELLNRVAVFDWARARLEDAAARLRRALRIEESTFGLEHTRVARTLGNLGLVARDRGDLAEARRLQERALRLFESAYGSDHSEVARTLGNLGLVARDRGDLAEARQLQERALRIKEAAYGPSHPEVARPLTNLGLVAQDQGELAEARRLLERALRIGESAYGPNHPEIAGTLGNLGVVARNQGELAEARRLQERALRIEEAAYGPDHPEVGLTLTNLGRVAQDQGNLAEARHCYQRASSIFSASLGDQHPDTVKARDLLRRLEETTATGPNTC
jgi:tetratricopeptide (TPR) repeat protein